MKIIVDLNKVQYAKFYWENQIGQRVNKKPRQATHFGAICSKDIMMPELTLADGRVFERESMYERAKRLKLFDVWTPTIILQFAANHTITYTGKQAQSIWKEWNRRQFNKKGTK
jgi:hypothetical protein